MSHRQPIFNTSKTHCSVPYCIVGYLVLYPLQSFSWYTLLHHEGWEAATNLSKLPYRQSSLWNSSSAHQISLHRLRLGMELYDAYTVTVHDKGHRFLIPWFSSMAVALLQSWQRKSDAKRGAFSQKAQHECWSSNPAEAFVCYLRPIMTSVSAGTSQNGLCHLRLNPNKSSLELYPSNKLLHGLIALPRAKHIALVSFLHFSHIPLQSMSTPSRNPDVITPASTILLPPNRFPCLHRWYFTPYYFIVHWPATLIWWNLIHIISLPGSCAPVYSNHTLNKINRAPPTSLTSPLTTLPHFLYLQTWPYLRNFIVAVPSAWNISGSILDGLQVHTIWVSAQKGSHNLLI